MNASDGADRAGSLEGGGTSRGRAVGPAVAAAIAAAVCVAGWSAFRFLTDDALIAFRYVSNRQLGLGYVWNAPPFLPVEGYTSFLWLVVLDAAWTVTGLPPTATADFLTLACSLGSLLIAALMTQRVASGARAGGERPVLLLLVLLGTVVNATFLMWTSSGLETALFNLLVQAWLYGVFTAPSGLPSGWTVLAAALAALTRPDGYLFLAATAAILVRGRLARLVTTTGLLGRLAPASLVVAHVLWRRQRYGEWLPNTYYAKVVGAWPESGLRYLGAFALENALWLWAPLVALALLASWRSGSRPGGTARAPQAPSSPARAAAVLAVLLHLAYYTLVVGGDHFEFRVYSYLVPLLMVTGLWACLRLRLSVAWTATCFAVLLFFGLPLQWTNWLLSRQFAARGETQQLHVPVADALSFPLSALARPYDALNAWLARHYVALRHQEHRVFSMHMQRSLPDRAWGERAFEGTENPVVAATSVGWVGWAFPRAHVLDLMGLNDRVIARTPAPAGAERRMAHDRRTPRGYVEAFKPILFVDAMGRIGRLERPGRLTDDDIRSAERAAWASVGGAGSPPGRPTGAGPAPPAPPAPAPPARPEPAG